MQTILEVENLSKSFGATMVLDSISFSVTRGEFISIMGPSGSGKSTLLYNISGMDRPTSGTVRFDGEDISSLDDAKMSDVRLKQMGFIFQHSYLLKNLSVRDNIVLSGFKAALVSRDQVNENARILMEKTGITNVAGSDVKKVSGGQLQRAAICRALINQPSVLFGDEPTGALNSSTTNEIMDIINTINAEGTTGALNSSTTNEIMDIINTINAEGTTVILVTHDAKVAARAERVIYLMDGKIRAECSLGSYTKEGKLDREKHLDQWLKELGF